MLKDEFVDLLKKLNVLVCEGEQDDVTKSNIFPRVLFFDYLWDFEIASSEIYETILTYQISYFSRNPRDPIFIKLLKKLLEKDCLTSTIKKEYVESSGGFWHYYFEIELKEDVLCLDNLN